MLGTHLCLLKVPLCTVEMLHRIERRIQCVQGPSAQTLSASSYSATVPRVQAAGLESTKSTGRALPTSADVFNLGEGIASLLGRRLLS